MTSSAFSSFDLVNDLLHDYSENQFPTNLYGFDQVGWTYSRQPEQSPSTIFGYVFEGTATLWVEGVGDYEVRRGMYFSVPVPGNFLIEGGRGILIERVGYHGTFSIGGPIEDVGRLKYIDGCTDSLLVSPVKFGDPCLNALYFPAGTDQTPHTHPSMRVGIVVRGRGECVLENEVIPLVPGTVFIIHEEGVHSFRTTDSPMVVIAYHPDSDFGPQDEDHPMINRTIVGGVSAATLDEIRTK